MLYGFTLNDLSLFTVKCDFNPSSILKTGPAGAIMLHVAESMAIQIMSSSVYHKSIFQSRRLQYDVNIYYCNTSSSVLYQYHCRLIVDLCQKFLYFQTSLSIPVSSNSLLIAVYQISFQLLSLGFPFNCCLPDFLSITVSYFLSIAVYQISFQLLSHISFQLLSQNSFQLLSV